MSSIATLDSIILRNSDAAHRALFTHDIFHYIALMLYGMDEPQNLIALARLARVCQRFFHGSIAVLWKSMSIIWPLLKTIPGLQWELVEHKDDKDEDETMVHRQWVRRVVHSDNWRKDPHAFGNAGCR